ncbi:MAG: hypothetical protein JNM19_17795 [Chitinophagaceae bacterium]|nr:hypothetical protein [Chitinophagaceae bacterium]
MDKKDLWPKEGKLKKGLIILAIVIVSALAMVLIEEQTTVKLSKRVPLVIAFACIAIWLYNPAKKEKA